MSPWCVCLHALLPHTSVEPCLSPCAEGVPGWPVTVGAPGLSLASPQSKGFHGFTATLQSLLPLRPYLGEPGGALPLGGLVALIGAGEESTK